MPEGMNTMGGYQGRISRWRSSVCYIIKSSLMAAKCVLRTDAFWRLVLWFVLSEPLTLNLWAFVVMGLAHSLSGTIWPSSYPTNSYHKGVMGISTLFCIVSMTLRLFCLVCGCFSDNTFPRLGWCVSSYLPRPFMQRVTRSAHNIPC